MQQQRLDEKLILPPLLCLFLSVCLFVCLYLSVLLCLSLVHFSFTVFNLCCLNTRQRAIGVCVCLFMHAHGPLTQVHRFRAEDQFSFLPNVRHVRARDVNYN